MLLTQLNKRRKLPRTLTSSALLSGNTILIEVRRKESYSRNGKRAVKKPPGNSREKQTSTVEIGERVDRGQKGNKNRFTQSGGSSVTAESANADLNQDGKG